MRVSTRGRYGLRLLVDLAENGNREPIALSQIAARQGISEKYLQQVALMLTHANILVSVKGAGGGYLLRDKPEFISVYEVLGVLEGGLCFSEPLSDRDTAIRRCLQAHFYGPLDEHIKSVFSNMSLSDLASARPFAYTI
jgi:Rrf2 family protein